MSQDYSPSLVTKNLVFCGDAAMKSAAGPATLLYDKVNNNNVEVKVKTITNEEIEWVKIYVDGEEREKLNEKPYETTLILEDGIYEYEDAEEWREMREKLDEEGSVNFFEFRKMKNLEEKYGLVEEYNSG